MQNSHFSFRKCSSCELHPYSLHIAGKVRKSIDTNKRRFVPRSAIDFFPNISRDLRGLNEPKRILIPIQPKYLGVTRMKHVH